MPAVHVHVASDPLVGLGFRISDSGAGLSLAALEAAPRFFYSNVPYVEPTYGFSGNFGGQIEVAFLGRFSLLCSLHLTCSPFAFFPPW